MRINNIITRENPFFQASPDYMVMDDVIPESYQDWLLSCTRNDTLLWNIKHHAISDRFMDDPRNGYCAFHYLYEMDERGELSPLCNAFMPLALTFRDRLKCECLMRMRVNNTPIYPNQQVQLPHVDCYVQNSWVVIYYIDDTDGKYAKNKYDGRPLLSMPWESAADFIKEEQAMINSSPYYT